MNWRAGQNYTEKSGAGLTKQTNKFPNKGKQNQPKQNPKIKRLCFKIKYNVSGEGFKFLSILIF